MLRVLQVNKFLYAKGGCEQHMLTLAAALERRGHALQYFGTDDTRNSTPPNATVVVPATDYDATASLGKRLAQFGRMVHSRTARRKLADFLRRSPVQIAHLHNIYHQLSPSVLRALGAAGVPTLLTAHDYKLVCPSYSLHDGRQTCFACRGHRYWNVLRRRCSRRGVLGDIALTLEATTHRVLRLYERYLCHIVAPSRFLRDRLIEGGFGSDRVTVLQNAIEVGSFDANPTPGDFLLFVGRLSYEKGLGTLLAAARRMPDVPIRIVGDGPLRAEIEAQARDLNHVTFFGRQPHDSVRRLLRRCRAVLLPSDVPENCPVSLLEGFATAKPAIATRVGGVPELFESAPVGMLVAAGAVDELAHAMRQLWDDADLAWHCGSAARRMVEASHDLTDYVVRIESLYRRLANLPSDATVSERSGGDRAELDKSAPMHL